jgi:mRNA interferase RelE/StbE
VAYRLVTTPTVRRQLAESLSAPVAFAAHEFIIGPLLDSPWRVGKRLHGPLEGRLAARLGTYRVIYRVDDDDNTVMVLLIAHRSDTYR